MPVKNIVPGQRVAKEKLQCDPSVLRTSPYFRSLKIGRCRREMTPAEKLLWQEIRANKLGVHFAHPPNTTRKSLNANSKFTSSDLPTGCFARGDSAIGFSLSPFYASYTSPKFQVRGIWERLGGGALGMMMW